jgi:hypothetical protein
VDARYRLLHWARPLYAMKSIILYFLLLISANVMACMDISDEIKKVIVSGKNPFLFA